MCLARDEAGPRDYCTCMAQGELKTSLVPRPSIRAEGEGLGTRLAENVFLVESVNVGANLILSEQA